MSPAEAVIDRLLAVPAVTTIVAARVHMLKLPQRATCPAIRVEGISASRPTHHRGGSRSGVARVQVDVYADEASSPDPYAAADALAAAVDGDQAGSALAEWQGEVGGSPPAMRVREIRGTTGWRSLSVQNEARIVVLSQDFMVYFTDAG